MSIENYELLTYSKILQLEDKFNRMQEKINKMSTLEIENNLSEEQRKINEEQRLINRLCKAHEEAKVTFTFTDELKQKFKSLLTNHETVHKTITEIVNEFTEKYEHIYLLYKFKKRIIFTEKIKLIKSTIILFENTMNRINLILNEPTINELGLSLIDSNFEYWIKPFERDIEELIEIMNDE